VRRLSDKLKGDLDAIPATTDANKVVTTVLHRLEMEYRAQNAAEATKQPKPASKR